MGVPGRLRWNADTNDGAASTPKTCSPSSTSTTVMGKPGPQPKSITLLPGGSVFAHFRTSFTPIAVERVLLLPRRARNSSETDSYPLDRSIGVTSATAYPWLALMEAAQSRLGKFGPEALQGHRKLI